MITTFKNWVILRESAGSYQPMIAANAVLFPVIHNQEVITTQPALQKMQSLAERGAIIWYEGEQVEEVVESFLQEQANSIPILTKLVKKSWETSNPKTISQQRFRQGSVLTSTFGGNDEVKKAKEILGHPFVNQAMSGETPPTIIDVLHLASNSPESRMAQNKKYVGPQAKIGNKWVDVPQGWSVYSSSPVSKQEIEELINLAQEPNMKVFRDLLRQPATEKNLVMFLKIGRYQGFNKPYANPDAPVSSLGKLQKDVNSERDSGLVLLVQQQGGIFFAGADHVPNVMRLMNIN